MDDAPWGFAPCHYGRWTYIGSRWGWVPGPLVVLGGRRVAVVRPVYAPALVAFIGGGSWGVGLAVGGPAVGWVPLGPREVYVPGYRVSQNYFRTVNVSNTTVVNNVNITNVYNTVYVNRNVTNVRYVNVNAPNAVTAMPQDAFATGRHVSRVGVTVPRAQVAHAQTLPVTVTPPVAHTRQAVAAVVGGEAGGPASGPRRSCPGRGETGAAGSARRTAAPVRVAPPVRPAVVSLPASIAPVHRAPAPAPAYRPPSPAPRPQETYPSTVQPAPRQPAPAPQVTPLPQPAPRVAPAPEPANRRHRAASSGNNSAISPTETDRGATVNPGACRGLIS